MVMLRLENRGWSSRLAWVAALSLLALWLARAPLLWAAGTVAAAVLILALAIMPAAGLVVLGFAIPFGHLLPTPIVAVNLVDVLAALTVGAWLAQGVRERAIVWRRSPLVWPLALFLLVTGWSLTQASSWREGLPEWLKWVEFVGVYAVASQVLDGPKTRWLLGGLFAAGVIEAGLGVYQFWRQVGPEAFILMDRFMRAYGTFRQPNPYAGYLGYLAPVAFSLALAGLTGWWSHRRRADLGVAVALGAVTAALALGIVVSWSRGSWLGLGASLLVVVALRSRRTAMGSALVLIALLLLLAIGGTGWLPTGVLDRLNDLGNYIVGPDPARTEITDENFAVLERLAHWQSGLRMFDEHPWLGVGIGNYAVVYPRYALPHWYEPLGHAHNVYVNFLAETGALGAGAFLAWWLGAAWLAARVAMRTRGYRAALALGLIGALCYLSVHNLFDNLFVQHMQLQLALLAGSVAALGRSPEPPARGNG